MISNSIGVIFIYICIAGFLSRRAGKPAGSSFEATLLMPVSRGSDAGAHRRTLRRQTLRCIHALQCWTDLHYVQVFRQR